MVGRPTKTIEPPPADTTVEKRLLGLRNDENQAIKIVEYLEGDSFQKDKHNLRYCKAYVARLIQVYCETIESKSDNEYAVVGSARDKSELLLAACGLLQGFEFKPREQEKRISDYRAYVCENNWYNKLLVGVWSPTSVATKTRDILVKITKELANTIENLKSENDGKLGFFDQVPEGLTLPTPCVVNPPSRPLSNYLNKLNFMRLLKELIISKKNVLFYSVPISLIVIAISAVEIANTLQRLPAGNVKDYGSDVLAEEIEFSCSQLTVSRLETEILLPVKIKPENAYIICSSSDETTVSAIDGGKVIAWKNTVSNTPVIITARPQNRISPDVYDTIEIIVNGTQDNIPPPPASDVVSDSIKATSLR